MEIEQVLAMVRVQIKALRAIRDLHRKDAELQYLAGEALENLAEQVLSLTALYHYKDTEEPNGTSGNGGSE